MRYLVSGQGWEVQHPSLSRLFLPSGTLVDDNLPQWAYLVGQGPPIDAVALTQQTYDYMVSRGVNGLGYPYWQVKVAPGIIPLVP
jgi:hypothetical protein